MNFPAEVFTLIKSFTKPEIWECECCEEEFNKAKNKPIEDRFCEECYEEYSCPCGDSCDWNISHYECACGLRMCGECVGMVVVPSRRGAYCVDCREENGYCEACDGVCVSDELEYCDCCGEGFRNGCELNPATRASLTECVMNAVKKRSEK